MKKLSLILLVFVFACKNEADPQADKSFFTKFYDSNAFNVAYTPLDVAQTSDGGYLVLGLRRAIDLEGTDVEPSTIYLMKTDEFGALKTDQDLDESLGMPAPSLMSVGGKFYFFCADMSNYGIRLIEVNEDGSTSEPMTVSGSYPLAAGIDGSSLMLLSYDPGSRNTVMSIVSTTGDVGISKGFNIGAADGPYAPESSILEHALRTGQQLPFFVGKTTSGQYYFNGMYNYSLSTCFTDLNNDKPATVVQGSNNKGGMSALYSLPGGKFAGARFNYGDNYFLPFTSIPSGLPTSASLAGNAIPELTPNAPVKIINAKVNGTDRILYASNTRGKQIGLFGYNPTDGTLVGTRYIGFSNSFEVASVIPTEDEGLLVLGTTYIAGRFPRICMFKLSADALGDSFQ